MNKGERPRFARGVQLREETDGSLLLVPEGAIFLNGTGAAIAQLIDGERTVVEIADMLASRFAGERDSIERDVEEFVTQLRGDGALL
jgi:pyrroloquinoline quinone biosynthesis protein D